MKIDSANHKTKNFAEASIRRLILDTLFFVQNKMYF